MSTPTSPGLKSQQLSLTGPPDAPPPQQPTGRAAVARKSSAVGRPLQSVRSDQPIPAARDGQRRVVAVLQIIAPPYWEAIPSGRSWCECGYQRQAVGRAATEQLILAHKRHQEACPLLNPLALDERNAA